MKKTMVVIVLAALSLALAAQDEGKYRRNYKVQFLAPHSIYVYGMGSLAFDLFPENSDFSTFWDESGWGPTVGAGYRLLNFQDSLFLHIEYDYSTFAVSQAQKVRIHTLMFPIVMRFPWLRAVSFQIGLGIGWLNYRLDNGRQVLKSTDSTFTASLALKTHFSEHICLRTEIRAFSEPGSYDYYWDDYNEGIRRAMMLAAGVEVRF